MNNVLFLIVIDMLMRKRIKPLFYDKTGIEYSPERDGDLKTYLESRDGRATTYVFKGFKHYRLLWDQGFLMPGISHIRLMWNFARDDEYFTVKGKHEIEGISDLPAHAGRPGIYDPAKVLEEGLLFEAHYLNPEPIPRVSEKKKR